jgi:hypothetical protein
MLIAIHEYLTLVLTHEKSWWGLKGYDDSSLTLSTVYVLVDVR